jgi:hypothetical protein
LPSTAVANAALVKVLYPDALKLDVLMLARSVSAARSVPFCQSDESHGAAGLNSAMRTSKSVLD